MTEREIKISLAKQTLVLWEGRDRVASFRVSTAANGAGEEMDSECTPRGRHLVTEKIGAGYAANTVFVGRQPTGETYTQALRDQYPDRDWIVTRIMWLCGIESGRNDRGNIDSKARYIYIHGTPDDTDIGLPGSRGCIRMRNTDVVRLFDLVDEGTPVNISDP